MTRENDLNSDGWEFDPSERPVPLTGPSNVPEQGSFAIADEAESIVRSARDELARENTDPTGWATEWPMRSRSGRRRRTEGSVPRLILASLLIGGCLGTFNLGWIQGAAVRQVAAPSIGRSVGDADATDVKNVTSRVVRPRSTGVKGSEPEKSMRKEDQK